MSSTLLAVRSAIQFEEKFWSGYHGRRRARAGRLQDAREALASASMPLLLGLLGDIGKAMG
jgi:hypothetical protein